MPSSAVNTMRSPNGTEIVHGSEDPVADRSASRQVPSDAAVAAPARDRRRGCR
jgi:hypothetical protein